MFAPGSWVEFEESKGATCASSNPQKVGSITGSLKGGGIFGEKVMFLFFTSTCCPDKAVGETEKFKTCN